MGTADAPSSYAANSNFQANAITSAKDVVQELVEEICSTMLPAAQQLAVADLGCSYGPNALSLISEVMDAVAESCRKLHYGTLPEVQFFLNDLPVNDFNNVFRSLTSYKKKFKEDKGEELAGRFYVAGVPGSFHGRLFPSRSIHFFHSSSSVHWLSEVPGGLKDEHNNELNKGNIYVSRTSPPGVHTAYLQQFQRDFTAFLRCRSEEIKDGGLMVLTLLIRTSHPYTGAYVYMGERITESLKSMAEEGMVKEADIDSFNVPLYFSSMEEVRAIVNDQGAFQIAKQSMMKLSWDGFVDGDDAAGKLQNEHISAKRVAGMMKSVMGSLFACHFGGENIVDEIFTRLESILTREFEKGKHFKSPLCVITLKRTNSP